MHIQITPMLTPHRHCRRIHRAITATMITASVLIGIADSWKLVAIMVGITLASGLATGTIARRIPAPDDPDDPAGPTWHRPRWARTAIVCDVIMFLVLALTAVTNLAQLIGEALGVSEPDPQVPLVDGHPIRAVTGILLFIFLWLAAHILGGDHQHAKEA